MKAVKDVMTVIFIIVLLALIGWGVKQSMITRKEIQKESGQIIRLKDSIKVFKNDRNEMIAELTYTKASKNQLQIIANEQHGVIDSLLALIEENKSFINGQQTSVVSYSDTVVVYKDIKNEGAVETDTFEFDYADDYVNLWVSDNGLSTKFKLRVTNKYDIIKTPTATRVIANNPYANSPSLVVAEIPKETTYLHHPVQRQVTNLVIGPTIGAGYGLDGFTVFGGIGLTWGISLQK